MVSSTATATEDPIPDPFGREPFHHPALSKVDKLSVQDPREITAPARLAKVAIDAGLKEVVRWKPRMVLELPPSPCRSLAF